MPTIGYSYTTDNEELPVKDGSATNPNTRGIIAAGVDGLNVARFLRLDAAGRAEVIVISGGASPAYNYLRAYLLNGGGSPDMNVNGSATPATFTVGATPNIIKYITRLRIVFESTNLVVSSGSDLRRFGAIATALTNGLLVQATENATTRNIVLDPIKTFGDFFIFDDASEDIPKAVSASIDTFHSDYNFAQPIVIPPGSTNTVSMTVRDNLTTIHRLRAFVTGYQESV